MDNKQENISKDSQRNSSIEKLNNVEIRTFILSLQGKIQSIELIHKNLVDLLDVLSETHQTIKNQFEQVQNYFDERSIQPLTDEDELIQIDGSKSEWDDDDDEQIYHQQSFIYENNQVDKSNINSIKDQSNLRKISPLTNKTENSSLNSLLSCESTSTISMNNYQNPSIEQTQFETKSNDKISFGNVKSSKSVTFSFEENQNNLHQRSNSNRFHSSTDQQDFQIEPSNINQNKSFSANRTFKIEIHEIDQDQGLFLRLLNQSNSDDYDLSEFIIQQSLKSKIVSQFKFPQSTFIRAGETITIFCGNTIQVDPQPPHLFVWKEQRRWFVGREYLTSFHKPTGELITSSRFYRRVPTDSSSSDILFLHSKSNLSNYSTQSNRIRKPEKLSAMKYLPTNPGAFSISPNNPIHPDHRQTINHLPNYFRSQMSSKKYTTNEILNRPKSSPYVNISGSNQDQQIRQYLTFTSNNKHQRKQVET